jgi:nucleotide-binding universal stress UspA family protein
VDWGLVWDYLNQRRPEPEQPFDPGYGEDDARATLDVIVERTIGSEAGATVERRAVIGLASRTLIEAAAPGDLLVVGARGLGGFRGLLLGSVSQHALHHASCPVVVVRPTSHGAAPHGRVVVEVDGSDTASLALRWALDEGAAHQSTVEVVYAWQPPYVGADTFGGRMTDPTELQEAARQLLDTVTDTETAAEIVTSVERTLVCGDAAASLLDAARDADLVVLGSRGNGGFGGLLLGSVSQKVARHASCPVMVIPAAAEAR